MTIKEKLKKEIDHLPDDLLIQVKRYLDSIKNPAKKRKKIRTIHLRGHYDNRDLRKEAYE